MRKIKRPRIGEHCLISKYGDKDPNDPWMIGAISEILETEKGFRYQVDGGTYLRYRHCWRLSEE